MEQWTSIETGMITNMVLAQLTAKFGWVSLFIIDKIFRNAKNISIYFFLLHLNKIAGLKYLNKLTQYTNCDLRVEFTFFGKKKYAEYK